MEQKSEKLHTHPLGAFHTHRDSGSHARIHLSVSLDQPPKYQLELVKMIPKSPGEIIDTWSILRMKAIVIPQLFCELLQYQSVVSNMVHEKPEIFAPMVAIVEMNAKIWMLEAGIRSGEIPDSELSEIGARAIKIRDFNARRVEAKIAIDKAFGHQSIETKVEHRSEVKEGKK